MRDKFWLLLNKLNPFERGGLDIKSSITKVCFAAFGVFLTLIMIIFILYPFDSRLLAVLMSRASLIFFLLIFILQKIVNPINGITRQVECIGTEGANRYISARPADREVEELVVAFNKMILRLETKSEKMGKNINDLRGKRVPRSKK